MNDSTGSERGKVDIGASRHGSVRINGTRTSRFNRTPDVRAHRVSARRKKRLDAKRQLPVVRRQARVVLYEIT